MGAGTRVLLHASTPEALNRARNNAVNLAKQWPNSEVEIVANAGAVRAALEQTHATDACLRLCENTLQRLDLQCPEHLQTVPAAVVWIVERQKQGWHYLRDRKSVVEGKSVGEE